MLRDTTHADICIFTREHAYCYVIVPSNSNCHIHPFILRDILFETLLSLQNANKIPAVRKLQKLNISATTISVLYRTYVQPY